MSAKLPINPILYLVITGLVAASGWQFWVFLNEPKSVDVQKLVSGFRERVEAGINRQPDTKAWDPQPYQLQLKEANFTGKLPPEPKEPVQAGDEDEREEARPVVPLDDIFKVRGIIYDSTPEDDLRKNQTSVLIEYLPTANVTPPDGVAAPGVGVGSGSYAPGDAPPPVNSRVRGGARPGRGGGRTNRPGRGTAMPSFGGGPTALTQVVYLFAGNGSGGDENGESGGGSGSGGKDERSNSLWPEFDHIKLVRVDPDCQFAVFHRVDPAAGPDEKPEDEKVYKETLGLSQDLLEKLASFGDEAARERLEAREKAAADSLPGRDSGWVASPTTVRRDSGEYNLGKDVVEQFRTKPDKLFNDVGLQSYRSSSGKTTGLRVTKVPPALASAGVQAGDVIISVNGKKVRSKAQAYSVGKRQYQMGERTFQVEIITRDGRLETKTYLAPAQ